MSKRDIIDKAAIERELLEHAAGALRTILDQPECISRKLFKLRFVADTFQRHVDALARLEQSLGGLCPPWSQQVEWWQHKQDELHRITVRLDGLSRNEHAEFADHAEFEGVCDDLHALLDEFEEHRCAVVHPCEEDSLQAIGAGA